MTSTLSNMDRDKLKLIVHNLKLLVDALESEVKSDVESYRDPAPFAPPLQDYDEIYIGDDDDGYPD